MTIDKDFVIFFQGWRGEARAQLDQIFKYRDISNAEYVAAVRDIYEEVMRQAGAEEPDPVNYMACVREHWFSIHAVKKGLWDYASANDDPSELQPAIEAWAELDNGEEDNSNPARALWRATRKGGVFNTWERKIMRSNEWYQEAKALGYMVPHGDRGNHGD